MKYGIRTGNSTHRRSNQFLAFGTSITSDNEANDVDDVLRFSLGKVLQKISSIPFARKPYNRSRLRSHNERKHENILLDTRYSVVYVRCPGSVYRRCCPVKWHDHRSDRGSRSGSESY